MFVPGAVKYLDVDGLLAICAPAKIEVLGDQQFPDAEQVYASFGHREALGRATASSDVLRLISESRDRP